MQTYRHIWEFSSRYILQETKREKSRGHWRLDESRKNLYYIRNTLIYRKPIVHCTRKLRAPFLKARRRTFYHFFRRQCTWNVGNHAPSGRDLQLFLVFSVTSRVSFCVWKPTGSEKYCLDINIFLHGIIFLMFRKLLSLSFVNFRPVLS